MLNPLRPYLGRLLGTVVATVCGWLAVHYGIVVADDLQRQLVEHIVELLGVILAIREATHRTIDKRVNPGDAASSHLATAEAKETAQLKAQAGL